MFAHQAIAIIDLVAARFNYRDPYLVRELNKLKTAIVNMDEAQVMRLVGNGDTHADQSADGQNSQGEAADDDGDSVPSGDDGGEGEAADDGGEGEAAALGDDEDADGHGAEVALSVDNSGRDTSSGRADAVESFWSTAYYFMGDSAEGSMAPSNKVIARPKKRGGKKRQQRRRKRRKQEALEAPLEEEMADTSSWHEPHALKMQGGQSGASSAAGSAGVAAPEDVIDVSTVEVEW